MHENIAYNADLHSPQNEGEVAYDYIDVRRREPAPSDTAAHRKDEDENTYERVVEALKECLNPTQMYALAHKLAKPQGTALPNIGHQTSQPKPTAGLQTEQTPPYAQFEERVYENLAELQNLYEDPDDAYSVPVPIYSKRPGKL